jgi:hypothetical protein
MTTVYNEDSALFSGRQSTQAGIKASNWWVCYGHSGSEGRAGRPGPDCFHGCRHSAAAVTGGTPAVAGCYESSLAKFACHGVVTAGPTWQVQVGMGWFNLTRNWNVAESGLAAGRELSLAALKQFAWHWQVSSN